MKSAKRQREKGASDTEESERVSAKKSKTQVSIPAWNTQTHTAHLRYTPSSGIIITIYFSN